MDYIYIILVMGKNDIHVLHNYITNILKYFVIKRNYNSFLKIYAIKNEKTHYVLDFPAGQALEQKAGGGAPCRRAGGGENGTNGG